jgi:hypothetical protein
MPERSRRRRGRREKTRREKIGREEIEERKYRCLRESKAEG